VRAAAALTYCAAGPQWYSAISLPLANLEDARVRFTIVTPVFNGMPWLPLAMESVAIQRREVEVEHIVLDGGSTDGSREWLAEHAAGSAILVFEPDQGQTDALIRGLRIGSGDLLGWLNADDLLEPGALALVAKTFAEHPDAVAVAGTARVIDAEGAEVGLLRLPPSASLSGLLAHPTNLVQPSTFFTREAYRRVGGLDRDLQLAMDVDLWMKLARAGDLVLLPDAILSRFRIHPGAKSVAGAADAAREDLKVRRRNGMRLWSGPGVYLLRLAYAEPVKARVVRRLRRAAR
jgi:glycosyltransferase involved in cell wall biosynthesis